MHDLGERRQDACHLGPHRLVEVRQVDREDDGLEVEILGAALARRVVDEGHDLGRRLGALREERVVGPGLRCNDTRGGIVGFSGTKELERYRMGDL